MDEYKGEKQQRSYLKYVIISVICALALITTSIVIFDIPLIEKPLHEFLSEFVPPNAFVWKFIKIEPVIELPDLPSAPDEIFDDIIETVIDTSDKNDDGVSNVISDIGSVLQSDTHDIDDLDHRPLVSVNDTSSVAFFDEEPYVDEYEELPKNVVIPEFTTESDTLSEDARFSVIGTSSIGDSFTGVISANTGDGNSMYIGERLLVLTGVPKHHGSSDYLAEICSVDTNVVYDLDDLQSPNKNGGMYAAVWCFGPGLPDKSANQIMLELEVARIDHSCIGSEFAMEDWIIDADCPG